MHTSRVVSTTMFVALAAAVLIRLPLAIADRADVYEWFDPIQDVRRILLDGYVESPDDEAMWRASIDGMISVLDDPFTQFVPDEELGEFNKQLRGTYAGIGAEVNTQDGWLVIVSPMDGSPALQAGMRAGDVVLEIEGTTTQGRAIAECIELLQGEVGTPVRVKVRHEDGVEEDLSIVRGNIATPTVKGIWREGRKWVWCVNDALGICYVRLTQFNATSVDELRAALDEMADASLNGLILDLRDNPGGGLPTAVGIADLFLSSGTIVSVHPRRGQVEEYDARGPGTLPDFPMVVLVNGGSASASEIVSGALKENGRAKVIGTRTFGKGSVQEVRPLEYGAGTLKYTTAYYHLPSGRVIHRRADSAAWGVDPDAGLVVPVTDDDYRKMLRARREFEIIRADGVTAPGVEGTCASPSWIRSTLLDEQLAVAVEAIQARLRGEDWPAVSTVDPAQQELSEELARAVDSRANLYEHLDELEHRIVELQGLATGAGHVPAVEPGLDLVDGTIEVRDRFGNVIGRWHIDGGDVSLALETLELTKQDE